VAIARRRLSCDRSSVGAVQPGVRCHHMGHRGAIPAFVVRPVSNNCDINGCPAKARPHMAGRVHNRNFSLVYDADFGSGPNFVGPVFFGVLVPRPAQNSRDISVIKRGDTHRLLIPPCPRRTIENDARMIVSYSVGRMTDQRDLCNITVGYTTGNIHAAIYFD
jgi:hypothetical protein